VIEQSLENWELIVVDDGSGDASAEIGGSFNDQRVRVIKLGANRGGNAARNAGIREAGAPLIAFLDSDDAYLPQKLEKVVAHFDDRRDLDLLVDSFIKIQPSNARVVRKNPVIEDRELFRRALFTRHGRSVVGEILGCGRNLGAGHIHSRQHRADPPAPRISRPGRISTRSRLRAAAVALAQAQEG
jgi:glycosyltransferase involved in cell wall biosynthesis